MTPQPDPTAEDMADFATPVADMPPPPPQRQSKGLSFDFNGLIGRLQTEGFDSLSLPQKELLWHLKDNPDLEMSPEQMAMFVTETDKRLREQASPEAQAQAEKAQLDIQKAELDLKKSQADIAQVESRKQAAATEIAGMRSMLAELKGHAGMSTSVGAKGSEYLFGINKEPFSGTKAADFYTLLEQVQGGTFKQAFNNLKGAGQITEQEGAKATAAIARLNPRQTEDGFNKALMDFDGVLAQAQARSQPASPQAAPAQPQQPATRVIRGQTFVQQPNGNWLPQ
jgi:hypothetical protein